MLDSSRGDDDENLIRERLSFKNLDSHEREKLRENFNQEAAVNLLNASEFSYQSKPNSASVKHETNQVLPILDVERKKEITYKRILILGIIACVVLLVTDLILAGVIGKSPGYLPPPFWEQINPYYVQEAQVSDFGTQTYIILRDQSINSFQGKARETANNKFVNNVTLSASMSDFSSSRITLGNSDSSNVNVVDSSTFLNKEPKKQEQLRFGTLGFAVGKQTLIKGVQDNQFTMRLYDKVSGKEYFNTQGQNFYVMDHYLEFGFSLNSNCLFGLGERISSLQLADGAYTLYSNGNNGGITDTGAGGQQQQGHHPFLMAKLNDGSFLGILFFNANAQQVYIKTNEDKTSSIRFISTGGLLDMRFFIGPLYKDVVQQYHQVIGKPKLMPYWGHGFMLQSPDYVSTTKVSNQVSSFLSDKFPVSIVGFQNNALDMLTNAALLPDLQVLSQQFPDLYFVSPFTHFISDKTLLPQEVADLVNKKLTLFSNDQPLYTKLSNLTGYCLDTFNPNVDEYLKALMSQEPTGQQGYWLIDNSPNYDSNNGSNSVASNPFYDIPLVPGSEEQANDLSAGTVPTFAQHSNKAYHFNLHSLYGTQTAIKLMSNLPGDNPNRFIISDSTFPGAGQYGIAHVFSKNIPSPQDLAYQLSNMVNFGLFGIPNVGPNLCGYYTNPTSSQEQLCLRYFQLAIISPLAVVSMNDSINLFSNQSQYKVPAKNAMIQRNKFIIYQRTELAKIERNGGALVRPMAADYPNEYDGLNQNISSVMFGEHIKVEFQLEMDQTTKLAYFPGRLQDWLDLNRFLLVKNDDMQNKYVQIDTDPKVNSLAMYQRGNGTIIPYQPILGDIASVDQLLEIPVVYSIFLDNDASGGKAAGHVLLDGDVEDQTNSQFYEIIADSGIITFNRLSGGAGNSRNNSLIDHIVITNSPTTINAACVLLNDYKTVTTLNVFVTQDTDFKQSSISSTDPLNINSIAYIFYGNLPPTQACDATLFQMQVTKNSQTPYSAILTLTQNMKQLLPINTYDIKVNITLLTDNSVYIQFGFTSSYDLYATPTSVYDRNFTQFAINRPTHTLADILTFNQNPAYFEIHDPTDPTKVYFTSQDVLNLFHQKLTIFTTVSPVADPMKFFGLGERTGKFFLWDMHTYTLSSNNQNAKVDGGPNGKINEYGKNGFYPIYCSMMGVTGKGLCSWTITSANQDFIFNMNYVGQPSMVTQVLPFAIFEQVLFFNLAPVDLSIALHNHIQFGQLYSRKQTEILLPPPDWAFGSFTGMQGIDNLQDFNDIITTFQGTLKFPFEGLVQDFKDLDRYNSFSFNQSQIKGADLSAALEKVNGGLWTISKSGLSVTDNSKDLQFAVEKDIIIKSSQKTFTDRTNLIGQDEQGDIMFIDYSIADIPTQFISQCINEFHEQYDSKKIAIQLKRNEISNSFCTGNCNIDTTPSSLVKLGNVQTNQNYLGDLAQRAIGQESVVHNINGLVEQIQYANSMVGILDKLPVISDSTTVGSGKLGFVGKMIKPDFTVDGLSEAIVSMQTLGIFGQAMMGVNIDFRNNQGEDVQNAVIGATKLGVFTPLSVQQYFDKNDQSLIENILLQQAFPQWRYMLLKYTRTMQYKQINTGYPVIRPTFFDSPTEKNSFEFTDTQFMYGTSLLASISSTLQKEAPAYFPIGTWCSPYPFYFDDEVDCFYLLGGGLSFQQKSFTYLKQGTITVMQSSFYDAKASKAQFFYQNTLDLQQKPIDLHIMPNFNLTQISATGELLIDQGKVDPLIFCYFTFTFTANKLTTTPVVQDEQCATFLGFKLGKVFIYNSNDLTTKFTNAKLNGETTGVQATSSKNVIFFDFTAESTHITKVTTIDFS